MDEVRHWQMRPLEPVYPIIYVDCLVVHVRENQRVLNKALYLVLAVNLEGHKELLGMWMAQTEGAKFWLSVLTELHNRGVKDLFIACVDGLTGLPEAIETVYSQTRVQLCMVHLMRNSLRYVSHKHMKEVATDLKTIYSASTESEAEFNLELLLRSPLMHDLPISPTSLAGRPQEIAIFKIAIFPLTPWRGGGTCKRRFKSRMPA